MPFDREAAKAAGYTDQEIDSFLAQSGRRAPPVPAPQTSGGDFWNAYPAVGLMASGGPQIPAGAVIEHGPAVAGVMEGGLGLALAGVNAVRKFGPKLPALGRLLLGRDRAEALGELTAPPPQIPSVPGKIPVRGHVRSRPAPRASTPEPREPIRLPQPSTPKEAALQARAPKPRAPRRTKASNERFTIEQPGALMSDLEKSVRYATEARKRGASADEAMQVLELLRKEATRQ